MGKIIVVGSGNAALCAGIAALEKGVEVCMLEKAAVQEFGGNSRYTAGAMRFAYEDFEDLKPLLLNPDDERIPLSDFGAYSKETFLKDLAFFNQEVPITPLQQFLVDNSLDVVQWLAGHGIKFSPIYARQTFKKNGRFVFWGGLTLESEGEGDGLVQEERKEFLRLGGEIRYGCDVQSLIMEGDRIVGVQYETEAGKAVVKADAVILGCGGFEANKELRVQYLGEKWAKARVRGTRHNLGRGIEMAQAVGAQLSGFFGGCHATPMDYHMPEYGNLEIPHIERKHYRKISYLFGVMLNAEGKRFVDEGADFRNYTYAQYGKAVLEQPNELVWQVFDAKVWDLLYAEYKKETASYVEADSLEALVSQMYGINPQAALETLHAYNAAVQTERPFDPTIKDGRGTTGLTPPKTNWANVLDTPPYRAYPVTGGITFTYGGLKVNEQAEVLNTQEAPIQGLYACGELVGGVFFYGYPGGSGLTSGAVFGRSAGHHAAAYITENPNT